MNSLVSILIAFYSRLLRMYPLLYREEFAEQMLLDFSDMTTDASKEGQRHLLLLFFRELYDLPPNLFRAHMQERQIFRIFRSPPVSYGLRGAIGYGIGFASITFIGWWISRLLFSAFDPMLQNYSIWYWETFQNERWIWLFDNFVTLLSFAFTGIFFGLLFSLLAGDRRKRSKYLLAGSLAWFIPSIISAIMTNSFGWQFFLSAGQIHILGKLNLILTGMFYSTVLVVAESTHKEFLRRLTVAAVLCPLGTYLYIKLLFYLWLEITSWFFPALMILMLILLGSLFLIAVRDDRKYFWIILVGGVAYLILFYGVSYIFYSFLPFPLEMMGEAIPYQRVIDLTLNHAIVDAILGMCFGLLLGLALGFQKKGNSSSLAV